MRKQEAHDCGKTSDKAEIMLITYRDKREEKDRRPCTDISGRAGSSRYAVQQQDQPSRTTESATGAIEVMVETKRWEQAVETT